MHRGRAPQRFKIVTTFQRRDDPALRVLLRHLHDPLGDPSEIVVVEPELRQRVVVVGVETR